MELRCKTQEIGLYLLEVERELQEAGCPVSLQEGIRDVQRVSTYVAVELINDRWPESQKIIAA